MKKLKNILTNSKTIKVLFIFTTVVYALVLCRGLLFKYVNPFELFSPDRYEYIGYNFIPFNGSGMSYRIDLIINSLLFVPFGFLLSMKSEKILKGTLLMFVPIGASIIFESLQYFLRLGAADITDTIMNTIGGFAGFIVYLISYKLFGTKPDKIYTFLMSIVAVVALILLYGWCGHIRPSLPRFHAYKNNILTIDYLSDIGYNCIYKL